MVWFTSRISGVNRVNLKELLCFGVMVQYGLGFKNSDAAPSAINVKSFLSALKSMSFSSEVSDAANVAVVLRPKQLSPLPWTDEILKSE